MSFCKDRPSSVFSAMSFVWVSSVWHMTLMILASVLCKYRDSCLSQRNASFIIQASATNSQDCSFWAKPPYLLLSFPVLPVSGKLHCVKCTKRAPTLHNTALMKANPLPLTILSDLLETYCTLYKEHQQKNKKRDMALTSSTALLTANSSLCAIPSAEVTLIIFWVCIKICASPLRQRE